MVDENIQSFPKRGLGFLQLQTTSAKGTLESKPAR